ncbi:unnamed protein product [Rhodiola kirilowii]
MGMTVAVVGMIIYSWAVELEKNTKHHAAKHSLTEEEIRQHRSRWYSSSKGSGARGDSK